MDSVYGVFLYLEGAASISKLGLLWFLGFGPNSGATPWGPDPIMARNLALEAQRGQNPRPMAFRGPRGLPL